jgi:hypothetical protein
MTFSILGVTASREMSPPAIYGRDVYYNGIWDLFQSEKRRVRREGSRTVRCIKEGAAHGWAHRRGRRQAPSAALYAFVMPLQYKVAFLFCNAGGCIQGMYGIQTHQTGTEKRFRGEV